MSTSRSQNEYKNLSIDIKEEEQNAATAYLQRKTDLENAISIINSQLLKKKAPAFFVRTGLSATLIGAGYNMISSGISAANDMAEYLTAGPVSLVLENQDSGFISPIGNGTFIKNFTVNCGEFFYGKGIGQFLGKIDGFGAGCKHTVNWVNEMIGGGLNEYLCGILRWNPNLKFPLNLLYENCDSYHFCEPKLNAVCDNSWTESWYPWVIIPGIALTGLFLIGELRNNATARYVATSSLAHLKEEAFETVQVIADKNQISLSSNDSLEDMAAAFRYALANLNESNKNYLCRDTIVVGSKLTKTSSLNLLFSHHLGEPKLFNEIFEFADIDDDSVNKKPVKKAVMDATAQKNQNTSLHQFFSRLTNQVDKDGELVYDKETVVGKIFAYAGISKK